MPIWKDVPKAIKRRFPAPPEPSAYDCAEEYEEARGGWQERIGRPLAMAMSQYLATAPKFLYATAPNGGVVFATEPRARFVSSIHTAIGSSKTWGAFRQAMPAEEYESVMASSFDEVDEPRPADEEEFDAMQVAGLGDGDYPPWLQAEMDHHVPPSVLERFGSPTSTVINGFYWHIAPENCEAACAALREMGYAVEDGGSLTFW